MLSSDHKTIPRDSISKENEKPSRRNEEKINLFSQTTASDMKPDFIDKFVNKKRGQMSSATTVSTIAQSQLT